MPAPQDERAATGPVPPEPGGPAEHELARRRRGHVTVTLLRHGEPDWAPGGGASVADPGLTAYGAAQARAVAAVLAPSGVDAIYVSPLRRAQETSAPLVAATGAPAITLDALAEIDAGATGMTQEQVDRYFVEAMRRPLVQHWEGWPAGESFRDFHRRITGAAADLLGRHGIHAATHPEFTCWRVPPASLSLVVVAHGGTNAVLLTHLLDVPPVPWEWMRFESELASFSVVQARPIGEGDHVWSLQNFNEIDPLRAAGLR
jgi:broad specificity phosphatase PhoE